MASSISPNDIPKETQWESIRPKWYDYGLQKTVNHETSDGRVVVRNIKTGQLYTVSKDATDWRCGTCVEELSSAQVVHTVLDGHFPMSGSGEVKMENAPYCPNCEKKPAFHGSPVSHNLID